MEGRDLFENPIIEKVYVTSAATGEMYGIIYDKGRKFSDNYVKLVKSIFNEAGKALTSQSFQEYIDMFLRCSVYAALIQFISPTISRPDSDSRGNEIVDKKRSEVIDHITKIIFLIVRNAKGTLIQQKVLECLTADADGQVFPTVVKLFLDQPGEGSFGYSHHIADNVVATNANDYLASRFFFDTCTILLQEPAIDIELQTKTVNLLLNLSARVRNKLKFINDDAIGQVSKLIHLATANDSYSSEHKGTLCQLVANIATGGVTEAAEEVAAGGGND